MTNTIIALRDEDLTAVSGGKAVKLPGSAIRYLDLVQRGVNDLRVRLETHG